MRQPLKLDRLPLAWLEWIESCRRDRGLTWEEIETASTKELKWDDEPAALKLFPDRRLPVTTMHRWHDIRVEQRLAEAQREGIWAREVAGAFARNGFEGLPEAVKSALGEQIFVLMRAASDHDKKLLRSELLSLMDQLTKLKRVQVAAEKVEIEREKLKQVRSKIAGLKDDVAKKKQLDPKQLQQKLDEIYGLTQG